MSARTKDAAVPAPAGLWLTTEAAPMFGLAARYSIDAGASLPDLVSDAHSLLSSALAVYQLMELTTNEEFAVQHLLRQAEAIISLADETAEKLVFAGLIGGEA